MARLRFGSDSKQVKGLCNARQRWIGNYVRVPLENVTLALNVYSWAVSGNCDKHSQLVIAEKDICVTRSVRSNGTTSAATQEMCMQKERMFEDRSRARNSQLGRNRMVGSQPFHSRKKNEAML